MKNLFFAVVALALLATSCAKDSATDTNGKVKTVSFSVKTPEMKTRAAFSAGDGTTATELYYAFYDSKGNILSDISQPEGMTWTPLTGETITVNLVEGRQYKAIFWAAAPDMYAPVLDCKFANAEVECNPTSVVHNDEANDAFWATIDIDVTSNYAPQAVNLKRPFAQLNIGASVADIEAAEKAGQPVGGVSVSGFKVPTTLNLATGEVTGEDDFYTDLDTATSGTITVNGTEYVILSTNYILVGAGDKTVKNEVKITMCEHDEGGKSVSRTFYNIPLQRNYRTFVLGNIITGAGAGGFNYVVKVAPAFENTDFNVNENGANL